MKRNKPGLRPAKRIKREVKSNPILLAIAAVSLVILSCLFIKASVFRGYTRIHSITGAAYFVSLNERGWATCYGVQNNYSFVTQFELSHHYKKIYPLPTMLCDRFIAFQISGDYGWIAGFA